MAASAVGPPTRIPALLAASAGRCRFEVAVAAKLANIRSPTFTPPSSDGGRPRRQSRHGVPPTEVPVETRLFDASESYVERDPEPLLEFKNRGFVGYVHSASDVPCTVLPGLGD